MNTATSGRKAPLTMPRQLSASRTLVLSLLFGFTGCATNVVVPPPAATVVLSASSAKPSYARGEPVVINLNLTNATAADVVLSNMIEGTLIVEALTRNGVAVERRDSVIKFEDDL